MHFRKHTVQGRTLINVVRWQMIVALVGVTLAAMTPARAAGSLTGTIQTGAVQGTEPTKNVDWPIFVAQQCADIKDGAEEALINAVPYRGQRITITVTGAQLGDPSSQDIDVRVKFASCLDFLNPSYASSTDLGDATPAHGTVPAHSVVYTVPSTAQTIALLNFGGLTHQVIGIKYKFAYCRPSGTSCV